MNEFQQAFSRSEEVWKEIVLWKKKLELDCAKTILLGKYWTKKILNNQT